jgi:hypothetical protein
MRKNKLARPNFYGHPIIGSLDHPILRLPDLAMEKN